MMNLVIIGGGTAFYELRGIINTINKRKGPTYNILGILDDNESLHDIKLEGIPILGTLEAAKKYESQCRFVFAIGSMNTRLVREKILKKTGLREDQFESIIHPSAEIDDSATIGNGCIIHSGVVIGNHVSLKAFNVIAVNSAIGPYATLEKYAMVTSLCLVLTGCEIGQFSFIGASSTITENIKVGKGSFIGVGSIVTRSLKDGTFGMGNPFRVLNVIDVTSV